MVDMEEQADVDSIVSNKGVSQRRINPPKDTFTIVQYRRKAGDFRYLSGTDNCNDNRVITAKEKSGRTEWRAKNVDKGNGKHHYNFDIRASRKCPRAMLSTPPCDRANQFNSPWGNKVDLWLHDHQSGRLRWKVTQANLNRGDSEAPHHGQVYSLSITTGRKGC